LIAPINVLKFVYSKVAKLSLAEG